MIELRINLKTGETTEVEYEPVHIFPPLNNWRFKAMVLYLGLDDAIRQALGSVPDPLQRAIAISRYENSATYNRNDPLLKQMQAVMKLEDAAIDAAWMQIAE